MTSSSGSSATSSPSVPSSPRVPKGRPENLFPLFAEAVKLPGIGPRLQKLLEKLTGISHLPFHGFSVATNPVAKSRMSALVFAKLLQKKSKKPAILHLTVRDHNRLGLQSELWGARALGIDPVIAVTGDPSASLPDTPTTTVNDLSVFELVTMAGESGLHTGCVLDFRPEVDGLDHEIHRIEKKIAAGAKFVVTQPVYDEQTAARISKAVTPFQTPVIMGILPLLSIRHAVFLHDKVAGIAVPENLRQQIQETDDPLGLCKEQSRQMLDLAKQYFDGACIMPPFDRFDILPDILN